MENRNIYDTVIIGSGPAGLTAAIYNIRADLKTLVISGNQPGGQLTITTMVENYPGFPTGIGGTKLMMDTLQQVKNLGGEILTAQVTKIEMVSEEEFTIYNLQFTKLFKIILTTGETIITRAVIVATGAKAKWLGVPGEQELIGHGISGCATCDGMFFRDKIVAVVGGGDVACTDADFLTKFASKLYLIHRRDQLRAQIPQQKKVLNNSRIEFLWNTEVREVISNQTSPKLTAIKVINNITREEKMVEVDGLFVAIGHDPATSFVKGLVEMKEDGHIVVGKNEEYRLMTSVPGIFAAGDCVDDIYRQAIIAAGDGAKAGLEAERWLGEER
jgi:thioredoxin reductase (NADPH)